MFPKETVVLDATQFMCLEKFPECFSYFHILFEKILIPQEVAAELVKKWEVTAKE